LRTQNKINGGRTVGDERARRRRADTHGAKTTRSSTHNTCIVCASYALCPGSRQHARPCRSKQWGFPRVPRKPPPEDNMRWFYCIIFPELDPKFKIRPSFLGLKRKDKAPKNQMGSSRKSEDTPKKRTPVLQIVIEPRAFSDCRSFLESVSYLPFLRNDGPQKKWKKAREFFFSVFQNPKGGGL